MIGKNLQDKIKKYKGPVITTMTGVCIMLSSVGYLGLSVPRVEKAMTDKVQRVYEIQTELDQKFDLEKIVDPEYVDRMRKLVEEKKRIASTPGYIQEQEIYEKQRDKAFYGSLGLIGLGTIIFWTGSQWQSRIRRREFWEGISNKASKTP